MPSEGIFMNVLLRPFFCLLLFFCFQYPLATFAADKLLTDGLLFENSYLHPGKLDFNYLHTDLNDTYNHILWSPVFKGGFGIIENDTGSKTKYSGGFIRPLFPEDGKNMGELILGYNETNTPTTYTYEYQGEYRLPSGLGFGAGAVESRNGGADIDFFKLSYRNKIDTWNYILSPQYQDYEGAQETVGGYAAFYNDILMMTYGNDGEQWRSALGFIAPKNSTTLRPALEAFFTDNSIGDLDGSRVWFVNLTLNFKGGFLSHPARLGRAMGPQGLEFGNPLGFLTPTWNRRLDVWELGGIADFRLFRTETANGAETNKYEALVFPFQAMDKKTNILDYIYAGGFVNRNRPAADSDGVMTGVFGDIGPLQVSVGADYNNDTYEKRITIGLIDKF